MIQSIVQSFLDYLRDQDRSQATLRAYRSDLSGFDYWLT